MVFPSKAQLKLATVQLVRELFYLLLYPIDFCVPKRKNQWLFATHRGYPWGDNLRAVFEACRQRPDLKLIVFCTDQATFDHTSALYRGIENIEIVSRYSWAGLRAYLQSRVCLIGYTNQDLYSMLIPHTGHIVVNLWHGVPLKAICLARPQFKNRHRKLLNPAYIHADLVIANSHVDRLAMSACMMQNPNNVVVTGLPRNDMLSPDFELYPDLIDEERALILAKAGKKLALYAPTFRDWEDTTNPLADPENIEKLASMLAANGYVFGMRMHPMEKNIVIPESDAVLNCGGKVYSNSQVVLRNTDLLISDYSSIWVDFLLRNKPIIGFCHDEEKYGSDRSVLYPFRDVFPGPIATAFDPLLETVQACVSATQIEPSASSLTKTLSTFTDGAATARVIAEIDAYARH